MVLRHFDLNTCHSHSIVCPTRPTSYYLFVAWLSFQTDCPRNTACLVNSNGTLDFWFLFNQLQQYRNKRVQNFVVKSWESILLYSLIVCIFNLYISFPITIVIDAKMVYNTICNHSRNPTTIGQYEARCKHINTYINNLFLLACFQFVSILRGNWIYVWKISCCE